MRSISIVVLLWFALVSTACQGSKGGSPQASQAAPSPSQKFELEFPPLGCEAPYLCGTAVGELVAVGMTGLRSCLVSLVGPELVLTASHCVPLENATMDGEIGGGCWVRWPSQSGRAEEVIECARIKSASRLASDREKVVQKDFAYIELKSPASRPTFKVRSRPLPHSVLIRLFGVAKEGETRILQERVCQHQPDLELKEKTVEHGMAVLMPECQVRPGDSGSPLLDENGDIVGVLSFLDRSNGERPWSQIAVGSFVEPVPLK